MTDRRLYELDEDTIAGLSPDWIREELLTFLVPVTVNYSCKKCGGIDIRINYSYTDVLECRCGRCGYEWRMEPVDAAYREDTPWADPNHDVMKDMRDAAKWEDSDG